MLFGEKKRRLLEQQLPGEVDQSGLAGKDVIESKGKKRIRQHTGCRCRSVDIWEHIVQAEPE